MKEVSLRINHRNRFLRKSSSLFKLIKAVSLSLSLSRLIEFLFGNGLADDNIVGENRETTKIFEIIKVCSVSHPFPFLGILFLPRLALRRRQVVARCGEQDVVGKSSYKEFRPEAKGSYGRGQANGARMQGFREENCGN